MADANSGYGQQDPSDAASKYNSRDFHIKRRLAQIRTTEVVQIIGVDTDAKTVDVQIMVNQLDGQNNAVQHGTIFGISYLYFQFGKNAVIADPVVGDKGVMVICDRDISAVISSKAIANPSSLRKFDPSDGIYIGGLPNVSDDPEQWVKFTDDGMELADKNSNKLVSAPVGWTFTGNVFIGTLIVQTQIEGPGGAAVPGNLHVAGTVTGNTDVVGGGKSLSGHIHGGVQIGGGDTGPPL